MFAVMLLVVMIEILAWFVSFVIVLVYSFSFVMCFYCCWFCFDLFGILFMYGMLLLSFALGCMYIVDGLFVCCLLGCFV